MQARGLFVKNELKLKRLLNLKFEIERAISKIISFTWFIKHIRAIYREPYPRRFA